MSKVDLYQNLPTVGELRKMWAEVDKYSKEHPTTPSETAHQLPESNFKSIITLGEAEAILKLGIALGYGP